MIGSVTARRTVGFYSETRESVVGRQKTTVHPSKRIQSDRITRRRRSMSSLSMISMFLLFVLFERTRCRKPHILFVVADDYGYNEGYHQNQRVQGTKR